MGFISFYQDLQKRLESINKYMQAINVASYDALTAQDGKKDNSVFKDLVANEIIRKQAEADLIQRQQEASFFSRILGWEVSFTRI